MVRGVCRFLRGLGYPQKKDRHRPDSVPFALCFHRPLLEVKGADESEGEGNTQRGAGADLSL